MKTYPLTLTDVSQLKSFAQAYESLKKAEAKGDVTFINHAYNWLQNQRYDIGTALRKSGYNVADICNMQDKAKIYSHIVDILQDYDNI